MGGSNTTTVEKSDPWRPLQHPMAHGANMAYTMALDGAYSPTPYGGERVAGFSAPTQIGQGMAMDRALSGAPSTEAAQGVLSRMMGPQEDRIAGVTKRALDEAVPAAVAQFAGSGMGNSTLAMDTVGKAATDAVAPIVFGAEEAAMDRALGAARMAPAMDQASYLPSQVMSQVGAQHDAMNQAKIDAAMGAHYEHENQDVQNIEGYLNSLAMLQGGGERTSTSPGASTAQKVAGSALGGLGTYAALSAIPGVGMPLAIGGGTLAAMMGLL